MSEIFELGRFDLSVSILASGVLTPAVGCTVSAYRKSILVSTPGTTNIAALGGTATLDVYDVAQISPGDTVFLDTNTAVLLTVTARTATTITLQNNTAAIIGVTQYQRIVPFNARPTLFRDERGTSSLGSAAPNTNSSGASACYTRERSLDFILTGGNLGAALHLPDQTSIGGGFVINPLDWRIRFDYVTDDGPRWQELMDYIALQSEGVVIEMPPGKLSRVATKIVINANGITFRGGGRVGFLGDHPTDPIFEVNGFYHRWDGIYFTNDAQLAAPIIVGKGGTGNGRSSITRCSLEAAGGGLVLMGRDWTVDDLSVWGTFFSNIIKVTRDGISAVPERTTIRNVHGAHSALVGQMTACFTIEKGALNTRFEDINLAPSNVALCDATVFTIQEGGGAAPEGTIIRGGRFSGGYSGNGVLVQAGDVLVEGATAFDCNVGFSTLGCTIATYANCTAIGSRQQNFFAGNAAGIVRILHPVSSDASQAGDNGSDHIFVAAGRADVHVVRPIMGNFIRQSTIWGRDGVHFDTGGTFASGSCFGAAGQAGAAQRGIRGKLVNVPDSVLTSGSFDVSHNADQRLAGFPGTATIDHIGTANAVRTVTSGTNLDLRNVNTIVLNGAGVLAIASVTNGTEGQHIVIYNQSASTATITDGASIDVAGSPLSVPQNNVLQCIYINGKLRVASALVAP